MHTFSIDFASHEGHLACIEGTAVRALRAVGKINDADIVPLADAVLKEAGWTTSDIGRIACNAGPGGFTSVRGGVTFANTLADQLHIPLAGYHGSALMIARVDVGAFRETPLRWFHSTKADELFACGGQWTEPTLVTLADALAAVAKGTTVAGDLMEAHRTALAEKGASFPSLAPLEKVLPGFLDALHYEKKGLVPWYGRGI